MIIALVSLIILVPIIYFLPLGLKVSGKLILIFISFCIANIGLLAKNTFPLWQSGLLVLVLVLLVAYILDKRLGRAIYLTDQNGIDEDANINEFETKKEESILAKQVIDENLIEENRNTDVTHSESEQKEEEIVQLEDEYLEEIFFEDEKKGTENETSEEIADIITEVTPPLDDVEIIEDLDMEEMDEDLSSLLDQSTLEDLREVDGDSEVEDKESQFLSEIEMLLEENEDIADVSLEEDLEIRTEEVQEEINLVEPLEYDSTKEKSVFDSSEEDSLYEELFKEDKLVQMTMEEKLESPTEDENQPADVLGKVPEIQHQENKEEEIVAKEDISSSEEEEIVAEEDISSWEEDEISPITIENTVIQDEFDNNLFEENKLDKIDLFDHNGSNELDKLDVEKQLDPISSNDVDALDSEKTLQWLVSENEVELMDIPVEVQEVAAGVERIEDQDDDWEQLENPLWEEETLNPPLVENERDITDFTYTSEEIEESMESIVVDDVEDSDENISRSMLQQQLFHTMVKQIHLGRKLMSPSQYEKLIQDHMHPALPPQEYFTFASLLIEHYIRTHELERLKVLLDELKDKYKDYPIIQMEILYLYGQYYENQL